MLDNGLLNIVSVLVGATVALSLVASTIMFSCDYEERGLSCLAVAVVAFILLKFL
jgi:Na+-transporting methylmalonyl-CoA/oxaloacetate decarboxylase beta subunit